MTDLVRLGRKNGAESTTDPESGVFHKGEHKKCFAYEAHTVCDRRGYILETEITPGNVHDSVAFDTVFERLKAHYPEVQVVTADAGYKTPWICKQIFDSGKIPSLPYKRPMTKKGNLPGMRTYMMNITIVSCARKTRFSVMPLPTVKDIGNIRAKAIFAGIAQNWRNARKTGSTRKP